MTESKAWEECAKLWRKAKKGYDGLYYIGDEDWPIYGLCDTIPLFADGNMAEKMIGRLPKKLMRPMDFCWPLTWKGKQSRVAFCLKMAEKTSRNRA